MLSSSSRDARARRSGEALRRAMLTLLERQPLDQITVRGITAEAGVHYATFFRHHPTKEALLDHVAADEIDRLVALTVPVLDRDDGYAAALALLGHVDDRRAVWTALLTGGAAATMRESLLRNSRDLARERAPARDWPPVDLAIAYSVGLIFETLAWWLSRPADEADRSRLARTLHALLAAIQAA